MLEAVIAVGLIVIDQLTKMWAAGALKDGMIQVIPGVINFRYTENTGAAFSLLSNGTLFLTILSAIMSVVLIFIIYRYKKSTTRMFNACLAMITAGAIGNLIDRIILGYVVDFIEFAFVDFAVFNVADACVTVGAIALVIYVAFTKKGREIFKSFDSGPKNKKKDEGEA